MRYLAKRVPLIFAFWGNTPYENGNEVTKRETHYADIIVEDKDVDLKTDCGINSIQDKIVDAARELPIYITAETNDKTVGDFKIEKLG